MTAAALVETLRARGVTLEPHGDRFRVRPAAAVTPDEVEALRQLKPQVLRLLTTSPGVPTPAPLPDDLLARLRRMPLDVFAREGQPLEVKVQWWPTTLWFVPSVGDAEALCREGIARPRIWTAGELISLLAAGPLTTEALVTIQRAREMFGGEVVEVRQDAPSPDGDRSTAKEPR